MTGLQIKDRCKELKLPFYTFPNTTKQSFNSSIFSISFDEYGDNKIADESDDVVTNLPFTPFWLNKNAVGLQIFTPQTGNRNHTLKQLSFGG